MSRRLSARYPGVPGYGVSLKSICKKVRVKIAGCEDEREGLHNQKNTRGAMRNRKAILVAGLAFALLDMGATLIGYRTRRLWL